MPLAPGIPDPMTLHPMEGQERIVFLRTIMSGTAAELEAVARENGLL